MCRAGLDPHRPRLRAADFHRDEVRSDLKQKKRTAEVQRDIIMTNMHLVVFKCVSENLKKSQGRKFPIFGPLLTSYPSVGASGRLGSFEDEKYVDSFGAKIGVTCKLKASLVKYVVNGIIYPKPPVGATVRRCFVFRSSSVAGRLTGCFDVVFTAL